jgi:hypothetical protein
MTTASAQTHGRPAPSLAALWDRGLSLLLLLVGAVMLLAGWKLISDTPFPAEQLPYMISAGIGGLAVLGIGATLWLSADLRDEWHKLDRIDSRLEQIEALLRDAPQT